MDLFFVICIREKDEKSAFSKCFSSKLSTYFGKSEFSIFAVGQKTKSRTSDFSKRFSSRLSTYLEKSEFSLFVVG